MIPRRGAGRPLVIGHRGAAAVAPENTLEALAAAVEAGADVVEFDVGAGLLLGHSADERPERPVRLDDALDFLSGYAIGVELDLKLTGIEHEVAAALRRHAVEDRAVVSSTWARSLRRLGEIAPELQRAISYPRDRYGASNVRWPRAVTAGGAAALRAAMPVRAPLLLVAARAQVLSLHHTLVSPAVVRGAHARGAAVIAWTVNDRQHLERVVAAGVDAVVSDDPATALKVLATLKTP